MKSVLTIILSVTLALCLNLLTGCKKAEQQHAGVKDTAVETPEAPKNNRQWEKEGKQEKMPEVKDKEERAIVEGEEAPQKMDSVREEIKETIAKEKPDVDTQAGEKAEPLQELPAADKTLADDSKGDVPPSERASDQNIASATTESDGPAPAEYVGVKKCKACHIKQHRSWQKTTMGTSFDNLLPGIKGEAKIKAGLDAGRDYTHDTGCIKCHTTGYGKPGGFVSIEETPHLANVQCEGCHGPGSRYVLIMRKNKRFKLADVKSAGLIIPSEDEEGCLLCHGSDSPFNEGVDSKYKFVFQERLEKTHEHFPLKYEH